MLFIKAEIIFDNIKTFNLPIEYDLASLYNKIRLFKFIFYSAMLIFLISRIWRSH